MSETAKATTPSTDYVVSIRGYLRITTSSLDGEIKDLINAARDDLVLGGVLPDKAKDEADALIKRAVGIYVKSEFGLDNEDSEKYRAAYTDLKIRLTLSDHYIEGEGA